MAYNVHSTPIHAIETGLIKVQYDPTTVNTQNKVRLFALWEVIDDKIVCKWLLSESE